MYAIRSYYGSRRAAPRPPSRGSSAPPWRPSRRRSQWLKAPRPGGTPLAITGTLLILFAGGAIADDTSDLIALDKTWGSAGVKGDTKAVATLLSDKLVSVSGDGVTDKKGELASSEPAPAGTMYEAGDYRNNFV